MKKILKEFIIGLIFYYCLLIVMFAALIALFGQEFTKEELTASSITGLYFYCLIFFGSYLVLLLLRTCRYLINKNSTISSTLKLHKLQHLCNEKAAAPQLLEALRSYLTSKLKAKTNLSTYNDLEPLLQERKVSETLQQEIKQLLEELEAADYEGEQDTSPHNDVKNEHALYRYWITEQYTTLHNAVKNVLEKFEKEVK